MQKRICAADIVMGINCRHVFPMPENDNSFGLHSENAISILDCLWVQDFCMIFLNVENPWKREAVMHEQADILRWDSTSDAAW